MLTSITLATILACVWIGWAHDKAYGYRARHRGLSRPSRRARVGIALGLASLVALTGCGTDSQKSVEYDNTGTRNFTETSIHLKDGRDVTCIIWASGPAGGPSCDWANAK